MKAYPALEIRFTPDAEPAFDLRDCLVAGLDDFQPTSIEEAPAAWRVFFDSPALRDRALRWLRELGDGRVAVEAFEVEDEDWARRTQADLQPVRVGRIVVAPPWCAPEARGAAREHDIVLVIVPSTGFGTGHHASTRLCLALLQEVSTGGRDALDIGTGSGVLAIAAARLGARSVVAVDNDADAVEAARENLALNAVEAVVHLQRADFRTSRPARADIVLANLTGEMLRRTARDIAACVNAGGDLLVSGVLDEERASVATALEGAGLTLRDTRIEDEWVALRFAA